jgi:hypothetical protein
MMLRKQSLFILRTERTPHVNRVGGLAPFMGTCCIEGFVGSAMQLALLLDSLKRRTEKEISCASVLRKIQKTV